MRWVAATRKEAESGLAGCVRCRLMMFRRYGMSWDTQGAGKRLGTAYHDYIDGRQSGGLPRWPRRRI